MSCSCSLAPYAPYYTPYYTRCYTPCYTPLGVLLVLAGTGIVAAAQVLWLVSEQVSE